MSTLRNAPRKERYNQLFDVLTDETRRNIIRISSEQTDEISEQALVERLTDAASEPKSGPTASDDVASLRIQLHHLHLPKLVDVGLIEWDRDAETVASADAPISDLDLLEELIPGNEWESIVPALADGRQREILAIAEFENGPLKREDIAEKLASTEADGQPTEAFLRDVTVQLHHHHLPKLEEAGLVDYDTDTATVAYRGPSDLMSTLTGNVLAI